MRLNFTQPIIFLWLCALFLSERAYAEAVVGQPVPALVATTLDGKKMDIADLKGKVVLIHFWATWCGPCREEMPAIEAIWRQYHGKGMEMVAVSADRPRSRNDVDQVMHYFTFPAAMLNNLNKNDFGTPTILPVTYIIDKQGILQNIMTPDTTPVMEQGLGDIIKALVDAKVDTKADTKSDTKTDGDTKVDDKK